jgi:transcription antitermination protein NusB
MPARHRSRHRALQILFQWDMRKQPIDESIDAFYDTLHSEDENAARLERDTFMEELVRGATGKSAELDARIVEKSTHWRIERMPAVDRNILRLAIYEMTELKTPPAIAIDEAIELARQFSGDESVAFVNGVLDAVRKEISA